MTYRIHEPHSHPSHEGCGGCLIASIAVLIICGLSLCVFAYAFIQLVMLFVV